eukprot:FR744362.1.p1 GENE.FR744362.1~~FR744362.1.p1  ORF type:complete len:124 (+),score=12.95 FR744362.1:45-374(+)
MESELEAQKELVEKTTRRVMRMSGAHREKQGAMEETLQEKQFRVEATQEARDTILGYLKELSTTYPETKDVLSVLLKSKNLVMPQRPAPGDTAQGPLSARSDLSSEAGY